MSLEFNSAKPKNVSGLKSTYTPSKPIWDADRLRFATEAAGVGLWSWNVDTDDINLDDHARELWVVPKDRPITFSDLSSGIYPDDRETVSKRFHATRSSHGPFEIDFRIINGPAVRWISARGQGDDAGIVGRVMFGIFLDVTENRQAEELRELLAAEMDHRIKNLFSIAAALTSIAARSAATTTEMANDLMQRLLALSRAQHLVRPIAGRQNVKALVGDLFAVLLSPYDEKVGGASRVHVSGLEEVRVGEAAATALALVVHELATNSIKYGALSVASGNIDVSCSVHGNEVMIVWTERDGPPVSDPNGQTGFGSKLVTRTMSGQLNGSITCAWAPGGVITTLKMSKMRLAV